MPHRLSVDLWPFFSATAEGDLAVLTVAALILFLATVSAAVIIVMLVTTAKMDTSRGIRSMPIMFWLTIRAATLFKSRDGFRP